jgi:hypothetical protein
MNATFVAVRIVVRKQPFIDTTVIQGDLSKRRNKSAGWTIKKIWFDSQQG